MAAEKESIYPIPESVKKAADRAIMRFNVAKDLIEMADSYSADGREPEAAAFMELAQDASPFVVDTHQHAKDLNPPSENIQ